MQRIHLNVTFGNALVKLWLPGSIFSQEIKGAQTFYSMAQEPECKMPI